MAETFALTNDNVTPDYPDGFGVNSNADWAFAFTVTAGYVVEVLSARMEIRSAPSASARLVASFYSDAESDGTMTIDGDDHLTGTAQLPAGVSGADGFPFGRFQYDIYVTCTTTAGGDPVKIKLLLGPVDINPRVTG